MKCPECGNIMKKAQRDYRYKESGLHNLVLRGIPVYECKCGNVVAEIPAIELLHRMLADRLFRKPALLTGNEIRFLRKEMGFKAVEFAQLLGVNKVTVSRWENQTKPIGTTSDRLIRFLYLSFFRKQEKIPKEDVLTVIKSIKHRQQKIPIELSKTELKKMI